MLYQCIMRGSYGAHFDMSRYAIFLRYLFMSFFIMYLFNRLCFPFLFPFFVLWVGGYEIENVWGMINCGDGKGIDLSIYFLNEFEAV